MSTLHTVNKSPFTTQALLSCLNHAKAGDAVLMIEDGVYGGLSGTGMSEIVTEFGKSVTLHVLAQPGGQRPVIPVPVGRQDAGDLGLSDRGTDRRLLGPVPEVPQRKRESRSAFQHRFPECRP